ncbi:DUF4038 domain-containing protein [Algoriphagus zhangzhouensis]|uniref:Putative collagen-binding domain of a collagenase n=1 Tax=Algoriphagus zhangzhouensis TaxID=1073327 RepID=A0A1M7Z550_9BACT|nr:DUF4038 domain-containing protein [Algoriphagus zhangzhouensis]TDY48800.1 collagenase-like protein with putative collagen-binding domain [Algoriphagus zhangzhouensis]SHO59974.1 Putative collagen-binding domain of a collagenase [Algoriphagus zhangzhouensis]
MNPKSFIFCIVLFSVSTFTFGQIPIYERFEQVFTSNKTYDDPIYQVQNFEIVFTSPTGVKKTVRGFWDGGDTWKVRFMPDEIGTWTYISNSSDKGNSGLHQIEGSFECKASENELDLYQKGPIVHFPGTYQLRHQDGTPFFWTACTAWNGALKSTQEEWDYYLENRLENSYNTIQLVTTQWRGSEKNGEGEVAFTGSGHIQINPEFFKRIDERIDEANRKGLLVSPVILWALPFGDGTEYSPGYYLPIREAVILAKYIVARYQGNHVLWNLGGDGKYYGDLEDRWKSIGEQVFGEGKYQGLVTLHPHGLSWVGDTYEDEPWYEVYTYQSSHSKAEGTVNWINKGPVTDRWSKIRPLPIINTEPLYEDIRKDASPQDIRNAWYWSVFAAPVAGLTYGANGIWPWLREGEEIENHGPSEHVKRWKESLELPGSIQMGYLNQLFTKFKWWELKPNQTLLVHQPGEESFDQFVSILSDAENKLLLVYTPQMQTFQIKPIFGKSYKVTWFNPATNEYLPGESIQIYQILTFENPFEEDAVLILELKE